MVRESTRSEELVETTVLLPPAPKGWHRHRRGGGLVQDTAHVDESAYVGAEASVFGNAEVFGNARVYGDTRIKEGHAPLVETAFRAQRIRFGLRHHGHIPTIKRMLREGASWEAIGKTIGWDPATAKEWYRKEAAP